jgi:Lipocalin-like domain
MAAVGGCCGFPDSAAAAEAAVLLSAVPMAAVGGCCPVVVPAAPAVGPDPASRDAKSLVTFSISVVHGPAAAVPSGKATTAHVANNNVIVFMRVSPETKSARRKINVVSERAFRSHRNRGGKEESLNLPRRGALSCIFLFFRKHERAARLQCRRKLRCALHHVMAGHHCVTQTARSPRGLKGRPSSDLRKGAVPRDVDAAVVEYRTSQWRANRLSLGPDPVGWIMYQPGHMSVARMRPDRPKFGSDNLLEATPEELVETAFGGYISYFGSYEVNERERFVVHRLQLSWFPNLIGTKQKRFFEFVGDRLILKTPPLTVLGETQVHRLVWERLM